MVVPTSSRNPKQRDRQIIDHVGANRLTTHKVLRRLFFPGQSLNAVVKVTRRLCRIGYLRKYGLLGPAAYYVLGDVAARHFGLVGERSQPLGPQSLPLEFATLAYATLGPRLHRRLTSAEANAMCPELSVNSQTPICLDEAVSPAILEMVRVDLGGTPDHVARKCRRSIASCERVSAFTALCREGRFRLVILTASTGKADAIRLALQSHVWPDGLLLHLAIVRELVSLTPKDKYGA